MSKKNFVTFVVSSGRSGTQWLARNLDDTYADLITVTHEPIFDDYFPREFLVERDFENIALPSKVARHVDDIERIAQDRPYMECGWLSYGTIRYLAHRFRDCFRVVHLIRHPVTSASSMIRHKYYSPHRLEDSLNEKALLTPFDNGVLFPEYRDRWAAMGEYEKCLYFWAELHALGLNLKEELDVPWLRISFETLFTQAAMRKLLNFVALPERNAIFDALGRNEDKYRFKSNVN